MKKIFSLIAVLALVLSFAVTAHAADMPVIVRQPQNPDYPAGSVAGYSVTADRTDLTCKWFIDYQGVIYDIALADGTQPWEAFAGASCNAAVQGNTYSVFFNGIEEGLSGSGIYAELSDGQHTVRSEMAMISVGASAMPPQLTVVSSLEVYEGESASLYCAATAGEGETLKYVWYETVSGKLPDIVAINRGEETQDTLTCDTTAVGTRYYVCGVETSAGGRAFTNVIPVTVLAKGTETEPPVITTEALPDGTVGKAYSTKITCSDGDAVFTIVKESGSAFNDLGIYITQHGDLEGTPMTAGLYTFTVEAKGEGGTASKTYKLEVQDVPAAPDTPADPVTPDKDKDQTGIPVWGIVLIAVGAAGVGGGVVFAALNKKK